ncbi:Serine hydrolase FSH [Penicillium angulare]|uniref:Serine hydrolase FSH n=1 Tax=Penicillium angulare TaxID=116970 RepID=UPI00253F7808|nr:Serine hydrolase FSH [Penicillium angulare]KAJ5287310.1 Serine hydrolase FSH [Penicillium angulare]
MRFLCLHGRGTCSQIFEIQTGKPFSTAAHLKEEQWIVRKIPKKGLGFLTSILAAIREEFTDHEFIFIDGTFPTEQNNGVTIVTGSSYGFLPATVNNSREVRDAVAALADYVDHEGPFDGMMGFSEGAIMAATLLVEDAKNSAMGLKCGIFFSGGLPLDPELLRGECVRCVDPLTDGVAIRVPTAIIVEEDLGRLSCRSPLSGLWGQGDISRGLVDICEPSLREVVLHSIGHQIPSFKSPELNAILRAMERTIDRATELYIES